MRYPNNPSNHIPPKGFFSLRAKNFWHNIASKFVKQDTQPSVGMLRFPRGEIQSDGQTSTFSFHENSAHTTPVELRGRSCFQRFDQDHGDQPQWSR